MSSSWKWLVLIVVVAWILWEGDGDPLDGVQIVVGEILRGKRVTHAPYSKADGVVHSSPSDLADQAHVDLDTYALARMLSSEEGSSSNTIRVAVCWAVKNHAAKVGQTIDQVLLWANEPMHKGYFGTQKNIDPNSSGYGNSDRYASTANDPFDGDLEIAISVILGTIPDPTNGATNFDRPKQENAVKVASNRGAEGLAPYPVDGIDPADLRFWGPAAA